MVAWPSSPVDILCRQNIQFGLFCFSKSVGDVRGPTFDHRARLEPASPPPFTGPRIAHTVGVLGPLSQIYLLRSSSMEIVRPYPTPVLLITTQCSRFIKCSYDHTWIILISSSQTLPKRTSSWMEVVNWINLSSQRNAIKQVSSEPDIIMISNEVAFRC